MLSSMLSASHKPVSSNNSSDNDSSSNHNSNTNNDSNKQDTWNVTFHWVFGAL